VLVGKVEALRPGTLTAAQVASDDTAFGFALFQKLCSAQPDRNLTVSPASASQALGMLDAGAAGATRQKLSTLLHLPQWSPALIAALHARSAALGRLTQVKISNHVFEQTGLRPTPTTLDDLVTAYHADLRLLDFHHAVAATDAINAVVGRDTDGLIPKLFQAPLDATTRTVLADAIVLDAKWQTPFPSARPGVFHAAGGQNVTAQLMQNPVGTFASRSSGGWQSAVLPYAGGKLQAVAMLPPSTASGDSACATPTPAALTALTSGPSAPAAVELPKLDLAQTLPLTKTLAAMGLPLVGDYTGLGASDDEISTVVQKVVMKVDRQGTKAAAATGVGVTTLALVGGQTVRFDRPFLLLLEDTATHTPLFLARVADPTTS
jgi:serpin B